MGQKKEFINKFLLEKKHAERWVESTNVGVFHQFTFFYFNTKLIKFEDEQKEKETANMYVGTVAQSSNEVSELKKKTEYT